ncbi:TadE-like protein [Thermodesulfitimonas autotrophica]|uniref:TadE-like protein n=1 Tax=Thermodesulfitimonas autotrophica TaxID=1894989 RepID=A0A3N5AXB3_9THEO|nr:TadE/TadG family type IV pilus assembly protein [Thermodesulfitimonas autotrophica]RPF49577.1 TadE-like protein [Thermodesulfitimonas autotrophica]
MLKRLRDESGMTTVEWLLISPFALFFILASIQILQALVAQNVAASAAREAARTYAVYHDAALARQRADEVISGTLPTGRENWANAAAVVQPFPGNSRIPSVQEGFGVAYSPDLAGAKETKDGAELPVAVTLLPVGPNLKGVNLSYHVVDQNKVLVWDGARTPVGDLNQRESKTVDLRIPQKDLELLQKGFTLRLDLVKEGQWWASQRGSPCRDVSGKDICAMLDVKKQLDEARKQAEEAKKQMEQSKQEGVAQGPAPEPKEGQLSMTDKPHKERDYDCNFDPEKDVKLYDDGVYCTAVVDYHIRTICPALPKLFNPDASAWAKWIDVSGKAVFKHELETP